MNIVKIFVSHRIDLDTEIIDAPVYFPVRSGAVFDKRVEKPDIPGDDIGENISEKNFSYCELTAQYWAWKNVDSDYYGFCHYRRYFGFNSPEEQKSDILGNVFFDFFDKNVLEQIIAEPQEIIAKMDGCPLAMTTPFDVRNGGSSSVYDQYASGHHREDLDILLDVIDELSPDYYSAAEEYVSGHTLYICNMFIMRKDLFYRYCEWLFPILFECEKRINLAAYNIYDFRVIGFLGERCLGIFFTYLNKNENINAVLFQRLLILNTQIKRISIFPRFEDQTTVVTASSNCYIPYLAVMLQSLLEHTSAQNFYCVYILHSEVSAENQDRIKQLCENYDNVSIKFYNITLEIHDFSFNSPEDANHIDIEVYFRALIHKIFNNFKKVLYLDNDIIIQADVADLFRTDIGNNLIGACIDGEFIGNYYSNSETKEYTDEVLQLKEPLKYFQAGVMLINIAQFRKEFDNYSLTKMAARAVYKRGVQDIFNVACHDKVFFLDSEWNVIAQNKEDRISTIRKSPFSVYRQYLDSRKNPKIIHYAGKQKPWEDPDMDFAIEFWNYTGKSPFYKVISDRITRNRIEETRDILKNRSDELQNRIDEVCQYIKQNLNYEKITEEILIKRLIKRTVKLTLKKIISPFLPVGSKRRNIMKKLFNFIRGR